MRDNDQQLGKPMRVYRDTRANIEALGLVAADEGCEAYATDINKYGRFSFDSVNGPLWVWDTIYNVRAWGATGDGVTDDTDAIQAAMNAAYNSGLGAGLGGGTVFFPTPYGGSYLVSQKHDGGYPGALRWPPNVNLLGTGYRCRLRGIVPDAASGFGIITRLPGVELHTQFMRGFRLFYDGMHSYPNATESNAIWLQGAPDCNHLTFQDLWLQDAYTGFLDESNAWGNAFINVIPYHSRYGFRKTGTGTGYTFINCFPVGEAGTHYAGVHWDLRAWSFEAQVIGLSMIDCAMQDYYGNRIANFVDQEGLNINGFDFETNRATNPGAAADIFYFGNCKGVVQGMKAGQTNYLGELVGEAGVGNLIKIDSNSFMAFDICDLGPGITSRKLGSIYTVQIESSRVSMRTTKATNIAGTGAARGIGITSAAGTAYLTLDRVEYNAPVWNPNNNIVLVMDEVSVGTANSGGAGFRLLRVPNAPDTRGGVALP